MPTLLSNTPVNDLASPTSRFSEQQEMFGAVTKLLSCALLRKHLSPASFCRAYVSYLAKKKVHLPVPLPTKIPPTMCYY